MSTQNSNLVKLSSYSMRLDVKDKPRYLEKLSLCKCDCPYFYPEALWKYGTDLKGNVPPIKKSFIYHYIIFRPSPLTGEEFQAFQNLKAESYLKNGWIKEMGVLPLSSSNVILKAKVSHSQALNDPPLLPWVALMNNGRVITAHCTCAAGLGEVCVQAASLLFAAAAHVKIMKNTPVTSLPNSWECRYTKQVTCGKIADIKSLQSRKLVFPVASVPPVTDEDYEAAYADLKKANATAGILSLAPGYAQDFQPLAAKYPVPASLTLLFDPKLEGQQDAVLNEECETVFERLKSGLKREEIVAVERATRGQASNRVWFNQRAGRVTSSVIKKIMKCDLTSPSLSLITEVCYPQMKSFKGNEATKWGNDNEEKAVCELQRRLFNDNVHEEFSIEEVGLVISDSHPFMAASPDRLFSCTCHGLGCIEVKCPFKHRFVTVDTAILADKSFPVEKDESGKYFLKKSHQYYYQVQHQLLVTGRLFSIFVVYTKVDLVYFTVQFDEDLAQSFIPHCKLFFLKHALPELIAKKFTSVKQIQSESVNPPTGVVTQSTVLPCICQKVLDSSVPTIICSSEECAIKVYHKTCTGLRRFSDPWKCRMCQQRDRARNLRAKRIAEKENGSTATKKVAQLDKADASSPSPSMPLVPSKTSKRKPLNTINKKK